MRSSLKIVCYILIFVSVIGAAIALISLLATFNGGSSQEFAYLLGACVGTFLCAGAITVLVDIAERLEKSPR